MEAGNRLVVYSDYVCPYSYLAERVLAPMRRVGDIAMDVAAFELWPAGTPLPDLDSGLHHAEWQQTVVPLMQDLGVEPRQPTVTTRTRKAHEAVAFAREHGAALSLHEAIFRAYWIDGGDIGRIDILVEIGAQQGLDRTALKVALDIDQWKERVEADERVARQMQVQAVPAYVLRHADGRAELRVGLQRSDELRRWLGWDHDV